VLFSVAQGAGTPPAQSIYVRNTEAGTQLTFSAADSSKGWLSVSQPSAPATSTAPVPLGVQVNPAGLGPGTYTGRVDFNGSGAMNGTRSATVALTVLPAR
jgi:hypothetical protein